MYNRQESRKFGFTPFKKADSRDLRLFRTGFTMIELMMAVVILGVGLVLILQSLNSSMISLSRAQKRYLAARIAVEKLEDLQERAVRSNGLEADSINESVNLENQLFMVNVKVNPYILEIEQFPQIFLPGEEAYAFSQIGDELQHVQVRVAWKERAITRELEFTTFLDARQEE